MSGGVRFNGLAVASQVSFGVRFAKERGCNDGCSCAWAEFRLSAALQLLGAALRCRSRIRNAMSIRTETLSQFEAKVFPPQEALESCDVLIHAVPVQSSREAAPGFESPFL